MNLNKDALVSLEKVLAYTDENIIYRFLDSFDVSYEEANEFFNETKKWLWACYYQGKDPAYADVPMMVYNSILIIDEMWHNFILFTQKYDDFCQKYFSRFISHKPTTHQDRQAFQAALKANEAETRKKS